MRGTSASTRARRRVKAIHVNQRYCSGCGICIEFCSRHVLERSTEMNVRGVYPPVVANLEACTVCRLCELYCGNFSIAVEERREGQSGG